MFPRNCINSSFGLGGDQRSDGRGPDYRNLEAQSCKIEICAQWLGGSKGTNGGLSGIRS
jgi:hypothetical protein